MASIDGWLATKYDILGRQADAHLINAYGNQAADFARAAAIPAATQIAQDQSPAQIASLYSGAAQNNAQAGFQRMQTRALDLDMSEPVSPMSSLTGYALLPPGLRESAGRAMGLRGGMGTSYPQNRVQLRPSGDLGTDGPGLPERQRYAKGTAKVPGKGSAKVDTVPAMLAPGEAVLNKPAAQHMGRGLIAALNQMGAAKLGMA